MASISVSIPDNLRNQISTIKTINWSAVAREAFEEKLKEINLLKSIVNKSKLSSKDAQELTKEIKEGIEKKHKLRK